MNPTPSKVKNYMSRGLRLLLDPELKEGERQRVIVYFEHSCAYCGILIEEGRGDLDHLISAARGGTNHISNRVFSCKPCNSVEKRDADWHDFLHEKHGEGPIFDERKRKIEKWIEGCGGPRVLPPEALHHLKDEYLKVAAAYDDACRKLRNL
jgi:hypothetical protein